MKHIYSLLPLLLLTMCQPKPSAPETTEDSLQTTTITDSSTIEFNANLPFEGSFEYYEGAWEYGYLYYRMDIQQAAENLNGKLFLGNYLGQSAAGGYIQPDATFEADFHGEAAGEKEAIIYLDNLRDSIATDTSSKYPNIYSVFDTNAQEDALQFLTISGNQLRIVCNGDTMLWDRVKK
jgi:hypothetical protein